MSHVRRVLLCSLAAAWITLQASHKVEAQGPTINSDSPSPGGRGSLLPQAPGSGGGSLEAPGGGAGTLGGRPGASASRAPSSISMPNSTGPGGQDSGAATTRSLAPADLPIYGSIAVPKVVDEEGPETGLSLDQAIETLVRENLDLRAKAMELPQGRADILTASLRANPIFYADTQLVPYGQYSSKRPGGQTQYDVNISYPLDLTGKRKARTLVATRASKVQEAQYQDEVRRQIDNLYTAYVDVLAARGAVRFADKGVEGLRDLFKSTKALFDKGERSKTDLNRVRILLDTAELGLSTFQEAYKRAKRNLGQQLGMAPEQAEALEVRGSIRDSFMAPPPIDELNQIALQSRPDIQSWRLGVSRAQADVQLARANILPDAYLLYQPYTFQDNTPQGLKSPTSWAVGITMTVPLYNRNQGAIQRSKLNVTQTMIELSSVERKVLSDVRQAEQAYIVTLAAVRRNEESVLPDAEVVLADSQRLFKQGELDVIGLLNEIRLFNDVARQYLDSLVAHRRSMLELNTALGRRILP